MLSVRLKNGSWPSSRPAPTVIRYGSGAMPRGIGHVALCAYPLSAIAVLPVFVSLPVFVPLAVIAVEPARRWAGLPAARG